MSLKIIKSGILDTVQDLGRFGYQNAGVNPGGVMDRFAAQLSNALLGKPLHAPVIEMHFPAPVILFEKATVFCLTGADFYAIIDDCFIPNNQPVAVNKGAVLRFKKAIAGARCYLALLQDMELPQWLHSYSTNLKAAAGGYNGRALKSGDVLMYDSCNAIDNYLQDNTFKILPFAAASFTNKESNIAVIKGNEWNWLTAESQQLFAKDTFTISTIADRMGYRLRGTHLNITSGAQLVSSAVAFGTLQLLPNGQLILLMADHQTTGGYPRIAHVISAHLPYLAQLQPQAAFTFKIVDIECAEQRLLQQHQYLVSVQYAAAFKIEKLLS